MPQLQNQGERKKKYLNAIIAIFHSDTFFILFCKQRIVFE